MNWLAKIFIRKRAPEPVQNPIPDGHTTSAVQYPAAILMLPSVKRAIAQRKTARLNWTPDKRMFTLSASPAEYKDLRATLRAAKRSFDERTTP